MAKRKRPEVESYLEWYGRKDSVEAAKEALKIAKELANDQRWREAIYLRRVNDYNAMTQGSLDMLRAGQPPAEDIVRRDWYPLAYRVINAANAFIAGKQRPKTVVLTKGADYKARMQAKAITKFLEGQFHQPQSGYSTLYDLGIALFKDAEVSEGGCALVTADVEGERVNIDRIFCYNVFFDHYDAQHGDPRCVYVRRTARRGELCELHPEMGDDIKRAPSHVAGSRDASGTYKPFTASNVEQVTYWDVWCVKRADDEGRYLRILEGAQNEPVVLTDEEYCYRQSPLVVLTWERQVQGVWSRPLIDQVEVAQRRANETHEGLETNVKLLSGGYLDVEDGSYEDSALENNSNMKIMKRRKNTPMANVILPPPFNPASIDYTERQQRLVFELSGVSELAAQGRKEPGIDSGVAVRHMNDLQGQVFLNQARAYEQMFVDFGKRIINAVQKLDEQGVRPRSWLPSNGVIQEIDWREFRPDGEDQYEVQLAPSSSLDDSLPGRLQMVSDLQAAGLIDQTVASRMLTSQDPDIEGMTARRQAQYNWIERLICEVHDEKDEDVEIVMQPPDPLMALPQAITQVSEAYFEFSSWRNTPENKRRALRNWILQAVDLLYRQNTPATTSPTAAAPASPAPSPGAVAAGPISPAQPPVM